MQNKLITTMIQFFKTDVPGYIAVQCKHQLSDEKSKACLAFQRCKKLL